MHLSIAPLMGYTNAHFIRLYQKLLPKFSFFSEMLHANAVLNSNSWHAYSTLSSKPIIQLGGSEPDKLAEACSLLSAQGLTRVNLNIGCPSPRVQKGAFGACLMKEPDLVMRCVKAMQKFSEVSIKCRLGVDAFDSDDYLEQFLSAIDQTHCHEWYIHARIAILEGLSPKQNREIPPINYARVKRVKVVFPHAKVHVNGELNPCVEDWQDSNLDGMMFGRLSYQNPHRLLKLQSSIYPDHVVDFKSVMTEFCNDVLAEYQRWTLAKQALMPLIYWTRGLDSGKQIRQAYSMIRDDEGLRNFQIVLANVFSRI